MNACRLMWELSSSNSYNTHTCRSIHLRWCQIWVVERHTPGIPTDDVRARFYEMTLLKHKQTFIQSHKVSWDHKKRTHYTSVIIQIHNRVGLLEDLCNTLFVNLQTGNRVELFEDKENRHVSKTYKLAWVELFQDTHNPRADIDTCVVMSKVASWKTGIMLTGYIH